MTEPVQSAENVRMSRPLYVFLLALAIALVIYGIVDWLTYG